MLIRAFLDVFFPPFCHLCKAPIPRGEDIHICPRCQGKLNPVYEPLCEKCGIPFSTENGSNHICGSCLASQPPYAAARAAFSFEGIIKELVYDFKYVKRVQCCRTLGHLVVQQLTPFISDVGPDLLVPVPLHPKRLRQRSFNQALLLGEVLAGKWCLPVDRSNLRRIRWTAPQINLSAAQRARNVQGAFAVTHPDALAGKRVVLVDDVFTTGSTVAECSRALLSGGAGAVFVATAARAVR
jgi:ComF family protein